MRRLTLRKTRAIQIVAIGVLAFCTGCNPFSLYRHRHTGHDFYGERDIAYYYYPHGSWFVPRQQKHHCPVVVEPPFHGFQQTCWTRWPEPWQNCPPPGMCAEPYGVDEHGEIIAPPPADPAPLPHGAEPPMPSAPQGARLPLTPPQAIAPRVAQPTAPSVPPKFHGEFGFSSSDEEGKSSAVAIELPERKGASELEQLRSAMKVDQSSGSSK